MNTDMTLMDGPVIEELSLAELFGLEEDKLQDVEELIFAARNGDSASMSVLGQKFMKGNDVEESIPKGLYWLLESADERSINEIASFYEKEGDLDRAERWYLKEVEMNGPYSYQGLNSLCLMYLRPEKLDIEKAEYYLIQSLEAMEQIPERLQEKEGYMLYQNTLLYGAAGLLGFYYSKINPVKAVYWLTEEQTKRITEKPVEEQKISAKALAESYNKLFFMDDVPEDMLDEAAQVLEPIAKKMGKDYILGLSEYYTKRRYMVEKYFYWKEKAAELGEVKAQTQLALAYLGQKYLKDLEGVEENIEKARYYLDLAKRNKMSAGDNPEEQAQLKEALRQVEEWIVKEEEKYAKHFTSVEAKAMVKAKGSSETVRIPEGYTHIDAKAFSGIDKKELKKCKEVRLPESIRVIENYAFCETYNMEKINLPKSLRFLGAHAFDNEKYVSKGGMSMLLVPTRKLTHELTVPADTKLEVTYEDGKWCNSFTTGFFQIDKFRFEEGRTEIHWDFFHDISIKELFLPDSVQTIKGASSDVKFKAKQVYLPAHLKDQIPKLADYEKAGCKFYFRGGK